MVIEKAGLERVGGSSTAEETGGFDTAVKANTWSSWHFD
jgi:hypothetical protein